MKNNLMALSAIVIVMSVSFATLGSTVLTADRQATINVEDDSDGVLALEPNTSTGVVTDTGDGELQIDVPNGVNINSTLELGGADFSSDTVTLNDGTGAYSVTNNFDESASVTVGYTLDNADDLTEDDTLEVAVVKNPAGGADTKSFTVDNTGGGSVNFGSLASGDTLEVAIQVNSGTDSTATFNGTINHEAQINSNNA